MHKKSVAAIAICLSIFTAIPAFAATQSLTVFAASSLRGSFTQLGQQFESANPGVSIRFSFLSSATLATQIEQGAPADLFISASLIDISKAKDRIPIFQPYLTNKVVIAVPINSSKNIFRPKDLNQKGIKWIQCARTTPCGVAADLAISAEKNLRATPASFEPNSASVLAKLLAKEVDAAIVYHTDIVSHRKELRAIAFKNQRAALTTYGIGIVSDSKSPKLAADFLSYLTSGEVKTFLLRRGFGILKP